VILFGVQQLLALVTPVLLEYPSLCRGSSLRW
jgi:hypothetical protein